MKVSKSLCSHPKYLRFKAMMVHDAMEYLIRLWGFCESSKRSEVLGKVDSLYVELACGWQGTPGELYRSLVECGFLDVDADGIHRVHDWDSYNTRVSRRARRMEA